MTNQQALKWGIDHLKDHQLNDAEISARLLLGHVLQLDQAQLLSQLNEELSSANQQTYQSLIERRAVHEPIWYLVGRQNFCGLPLYADQRVLIPRPETEQLVQLVIEYVRDHPVTSILEVGTGSGAIILALANQLKDHPLQFSATDISVEALRVARQNAEQHQLTERVHFIQADLMGEQSASLIVANLPYIPSARIDQLEPDVKDYEPHLALDGGPDGLDLYHRLFQQLNQQKKRPHVLFLEIDETHGTSLPTLVQQLWPNASVQIHHDFAGLVRFAQIDL